MRVRVGDDVFGLERASVGEYLARGAGDGEVTQITQDEVDALLMRDLSGYLEPLSDETLRAGLGSGHPDAAARSSGASRAGSTASR